ALDVVEKKDWKALTLRKLAPVIALPVILWAVTRLTADPEYSGGLLQTLQRFSIWGNKNALAWALQYAPTMPLVAWLLLRLRYARWWWLPVFGGATWWASPDLAVYGPLRLLFAAFAGLTAPALV